MKKKHIIIAIIILILIAIASFVGYNIIVENGRQYEIDKVEQYNYFILKQNELFGVIDTKGNIVIEPQYTEIKIPNPEKAVFVCYKGENVKILNESKQEMFTEYGKVEPIRLKNVVSDLMYEKSILKYTLDGKYGLLDFQGKKITKPIYDEIDSLPYKEGALLVKQEEKYGVINIKGNKLVDIKYDTIAIDEYEINGSYYYSGYIVSVKTEEGYRYGYIENNGKEILKTEYNEISRVNDIEDKEKIYLICAKNGQYGVVKGQENILENEYQSIRYDTTNHVFVVEKSKKFGVANLEGKLIVPVEYNQIDITGIYFYAQNEQGTTVYNSNGTQANIDANAAILNTDNEKYRIRINSEKGTKYGVINHEGKQLIEEKYNYIEYLYDNYFIVSYENGKLGIVDDKDNVKVEMDKDSLQKIQGTDLLQASLEEKKLTQIYNKQMEKICEMSNAIIEVKDDYIEIYNEVETKYFSKEGNELKNTEVFSNNQLFVKVENNKYGYTNKSGDIIVQPIYEKAYEFNQYGFAAIKKDGKWGVLNQKGEEVVKPTYEIKEQTEPSFIGKYYRVTYGFGENYYTDSI